MEKKEQGKRGLNHNNFAICLQSDDVMLYMLQLVHASVALQQCSNLCCDQFNPGSRQVKCDLVGRPGKPGNGGL